MTFPRWVSTIAAIAVFGTSLFLFIARSAKPEFDPDSYAYLGFAELITSGDLFKPSSGLDLPLQRSTRTPAYPSLLALTQLLPGSGGKVQPLVLHAAIAIATLIAVPIMLRDSVSPFFSCGAVYLAQFLMRDHYRFVMTEWFSLHLILVICALWAASGGRSGARYAVARGLFVSIAILARPASMVLAPLAILHQCIIDRSWRGLTKFAVSLGLPLICWMAFNLATIQSFSITAFGGFCLFGVAGAVGAPAPRPSDSPKFADFLRTANDQKRPPAGRENDAVFPSRLDGYRYYATCFDHNVWLVGRVYAEKNGIGYMEANQLMADYARRTLPENLGRYTYYISTSLREALRLQIPWTWPLLAVASMAALLVLATSGSPVPLRHLALSCLGMGLLHAGHMLLCSATCLLIPRYQAITATPWLVSCILLVGGGLKVASRRSWLTTSSARTPR